MGLPKVGVEAVVEGMAKFGADSKKVNKAYEDMDTGATKLGKSSFSLTSTLAGLGESILKIGVVAGGAALAGITALGAGLATFAVGGIKQAIDLDQQVANIAATMGATQETAGTLKEELKGLALDLSLNPNLTVDVTQAGQAIEVLAANGALATDEFGKLTEASKDLAVQTVALANATGSDFTTAANIATGAADLFGLQVDEMGKAIDGAAGIMNASKFNAVDYQLALSQAGGVAAGAGVSLEDFNTILAATSSQFASGSDAGTALKAFLQQLAAPTDKAKAAMEKYGISLFDATGKMRPMSEITQDLTRVFTGTFTITSQVGGATKEQAKAAEQASAKIGDLTRDIGENRDKLKLMTDVYQESLKFYDAGEPKMRTQALAIQRLTNDITDQEEKLASYNAAINTVAGTQARTVTTTQKLSDAEKAWLADTIAGSDGVRILNGLTQITGDEFNALSESVNRSGQGLEAAALRVDTVKGAMDIFKGVLQAIQIQVGDKFLPIIKQMAVNFTQFATQQGPMVVEFFGQVATAIGNAIDGITVSINKVAGAFQRFGARGATVSIMGMLGIDPATIGTIFTAIDDLTTRINTLQTIFQQFGAMGAGISLLSMLGLSPETIASVTTGIQGVMDAFNVLANWWFTTWPQIQAAALTGWEILKGIFVGFQTALGPILTQLNTQFTQVFTQLGQTLASLGLEWSDVWNALWTATKIVAAGIGAVILGIIGVIAGLATAISAAVSAAITMFENLASNVSTIITGLTGIVVGFNKTLSGILSLDLAQTLEGAKILLQGFANFFSGLWQGMITVATGSLNILTGTISGFVQGIINFFKGMYTQLVGGSIVPDMINAIANWFKRLPQMVMNALGNLISVIVEPFEDALDAAKEMWKPEKWFELGESVITGILEGIKKNQAEVLEMLKSLAASALQTAMSAIGASSPSKEFMIVGESMVQGMLVGANQANFAKKFIDDLNMGGIARSLGTGGGQWRNFRNIIKNQLGASFEQLMTSGMSPAEIINQIQTVAARFNFPPSFASEFAAANGLIEHLTDSVAEFQQAMRLENMGRMAQIGGQFSSLGSTFADMIQQQMGSTDEANKTIESYKELTTEATNQALELAKLKAELDKLSIAEGVNQEAVDKKRLAIEQATNKIGFSERQLEIYRQELAVLMEDEEGNALQIEKKTLQIDKQVEAIEVQKQQLISLQTELAKLTTANEVDTEAIEKKQEAITKLTEEMKKNQAAVIKTTDAFGALATGSMADQIAFLQAFLESGQSTIRVIGEELGGVFAGTGITSDVFWNRVSAQEELNRLLAEQQRQEELITQQKEAQQKLSFLQAQIDLIKLGKELGGNIFQGITFGLNASVTDLLAATNNVVEAMVSQINQDLQIASPSKVMMRIGQQVMAGLQRGVASMTPVLSGQLSASVMGPLSPAVAGAMNSNYNSTSNTFNLGGNTINNGMNGAEFEARVLQVIRRNL